jgi:hypothetical protein
MPVGLDLQVAEIIGQIGRMSHGIDDRSAVAVTVHPRGRGKLLRTKFSQEQIQKRNILDCGDDSNIANAE